MQAPSEFEIERFRAPGSNFCSNSRGGYAQKNFALKHNCNYKVLDIETSFRVPPVALTKEKRILSVVRRWQPQI